MNTDMEVLKLFPATYSMLNVQALLDQLFTEDDTYTVRSVGDKDFYLWESGIWSRATSRDVNAFIARKIMEGVDTVAPPKRGQTVEEAIWQAAPLNGEGKPFSATVARVRELGEGISLLTATDIDHEPADPDLIVMGNGVFSISKRCIVDKWSPRYPHTWKLDFNYDPGAEAPRFVSYIESITDTQPNTRLFLQEYLGYILTGRTDRQTALYLMGASGAGKSVFANVCAEIVGAANVESANGDVGKWAMGQWEGAKLITFADARSVADPRKLGEVILQIVGNDKVTVERKGKDPYTAHIDANILICSNTAIPIYDEAGVAIKRFKGVYLDRVFRGTANEDRNLMDKVTTELSGVFNWALEGLQRLERNDTFTTPDTHEQVLAKLRSASSKTAEFYEEILTSTGDIRDVLDTRDIQVALKAWLGNAKVPNQEITIKGINSRLEQYGYDVSRPKDDKGKNLYAIAGVGFCEEYERYRTDTSRRAERARNNQARRQPVTTPDKQKESAPTSQPQPEQQEIILF